MTTLVSTAFRVSAATVVLCALALPASAQRSRLGPADGLALSGQDTGRVTVGSVAPGFTLESKDGDTVTLSDFRGKKNIVLVFYRGHW